MASNFITHEKFNTLVREEASIKKWNTLTIGELYKVLTIDEIPTNGYQSSGTIAKVENVVGETISVWLTPLIRDELKRYKQLQNNIYVKPLGLKQSKETGYYYQDFIVVMDK